MIDRVLKYPLQSALVLLACSMLIPAAVITGVAVAFVFFPVAIAVLPFMLPSFFGQAMHEHRDEVALHMSGRALHAHAHAH